MMYFIGSYLVSSRIGNTPDENVTCQADALATLDSTGKAAPLVDLD